MSSAYEDRCDAARHIGDWTEKHLGVRLQATCEKDFAMIELWDDRCVAVEPNTGRALGVRSTSPAAGCNPTPRAGPGMTCRRDDAR